MSRREIELILKIVADIQDSSPAARQRLRLSLLQWTEWDRLEQREAKRMKNRKKRQYRMTAWDWECYRDWKQDSKTMEISPMLVTVFSFKES